MKKVFKAVAAVILAAVACSAAAFTGCSSSEDVVSIQEISYSYSDGNVDTYTIYYTDGSTTTFTVTNGTDGKDGENGENGTNGFTVTELYESYKDYYGDDITYAEFLSLYLSAASDNSAAINGTLLSVAKVYTEFDFTYSTSSHFYPGSGTTGSAIAAYTGSAVLYSMGDEYSYFVTNYHVVYDADYADGIADRIHLYLYGSESEPSGSDYITYGGYQFATSYTYDDYAIEGEYIGGSAASDIAVIRVKTADVTAINSEFKPVTFASGYYVGEAAYTVGNAEGYGLSVTEGIVSVDSEYISLSVDGTSRYYRSIRIDTALYEGNSGGGLFNANGELIGIVNAGNSTDQNINYAIPVSIVTGTVDNIIYYYEDGDSSTNDSYTVTVGITYTTENSKYVYDSVSGYGSIMENIKISAITENSIAETIGLQADDYLTEIHITDSDGNTTTYSITRAFTVTDQLLTIRPDYSISFTYTRGGVEGTTSVYTVTSSDLTERD